ncbi:hypothetical protein YERSI8AC_100029 [Enterobacterales bacterium 8AC]|nr:hypothetical protein YERSI8AC_100029 [Enterobacterales bacterium 8AC]
MMSWVATSPMILIDNGGLSSAQYAWTQVPIFVAVILGRPPYSACRAKCGTIRQSFYPPRLGMVRWRDPPLASA